MFNIFKKFKKFKRKEKVEVVNDYPYLDLLSDNSPQVFPEYYEDAAILNKQINEPNVYNIAVVAKYGAGKSSVINTYLSRYRNSKSRKEKNKTSEKQLAKPENNKYTRISLSTFNKTDYDEIAIERSILQQLLYSRKKSKLPNSKIERTNKTSKGKSFWFALLFTIFVVSTALMGIEFSLFGRDIATMGATSLFGVSWVKYFLLSLSAFLLFWIVLWALHYRKLKKVKYKDLEADIIQEEDKDKSKQVTNLINKFIDEVLYFFECIDIDLVIFEDLDRLPTTEIFVKLRELNTIINSSAKREKKVTFLYAVKDELFKTEEERAKFFEFILPVVPVINPVTTKSQMESRLAILTAKNKDMQLSGKFIKGISTYIPDMRVLKNTFNDYIMMYHKIFEDDKASKHLKTENLFALCLYKNLFPYDYTLLEKNEGLIPLVIDLKSFKSKCCESIDAELTLAENDIKRFQNEKLKSFDELKAMFIGQLSQMSDTYSRYRPIEPSEITTFEKLDFSNLKHPGYRSSNYIVNLPTGQSEVLTPSGERYIDREKTLKAIEDNGIEKCKKRITELKNQKAGIQSWGLKDFVSRQGLNFCFKADLKENYKSIIKGFKAENQSDKQIEIQISYLRFLIAQNYIDEQYIEYTSNYEAGNLSPADIKAVQNIQSGQVDFDVNFENLPEVIRWLDDEYFSSPSIISKSVLDNIISLQKLSLKENDKKYENLINLLSGTDDSAIFDLLQDYLNVAEDDKCETILEQLIPKRLSFCGEILSSDKLRLNSQDLVLAAAIKYSKSYDSYENKEIISQYINNRDNYLQILSSVNDDKKVEKFLDTIKPEIKLLSSGDEDNEIQKYIVENDMYEIKLENLATIFNVGSVMQNCDFYTKNYETIFASDKECVKNYIQNNIDEYISKILLNAEVTCENESSENMLSLLSDEQVSIEHRKLLVAKIKVKFDDVKQLTTELYESLFANDRVAPTWRNIQIAYEVKGFDCVRDFIKRNKAISDKFVGLEEINEETPMQLINSILKGFNEKEIIDVIKTLPAIAHIGGLEFSEIEDAVLSEFISFGKTKFNNNDLSLLEEKPKVLCAYIISHSKEITDNFDEFFSEEMPQDCYASIISCLDIDEDIKKKLIETDYNLIEIDGYEQIYVDYILSGHAVPTEILWQFSNTSLDADKKYRMLEVCNYGGESCDLAQLKGYLMAISDSFKNLFSAKKETVVEISENIKKLLDILYDKKIISSYKKVRNREEYSVKAA